MRAVSNQIAATSAFVPEPTPLHVPVMGGLHIYSPETVRSALQSQPHPPLTGRFVEWEISKAKELRARVELDTNEEWMQRLQLALPQGKPWHVYYVRLGSAAGIDGMRRHEFLTALRSTFPIDGSSSFSLPSPLFEYHDVPVQPKKPAQPQPQPPPKKAAKKLSKKQRKVVGALVQAGEAIRRLADRNAASLRALRAAARAAAVHKARMRGLLPEPEPESEPGDGGMEAG